MILCVWIYGCFVVSFVSTLWSVTTIHSKTNIFPAIFFHRSFFHLLLRFIVCLYSFDDILKDSHQLYVFFLNLLMRFFEWRKSQDVFFSVFIHLCMTKKKNLLKLFHWLLFHRWQPITTNEIQDVSLFFFCFIYLTEWHLNRFFGASIVSICSARNCPIGTNNL